MSKISLAIQDMKVVGLDPNPEMEPYANQAADAAGLNQQQVQLLPGVAEQMPVADQSQDAVVCTLVCHSYLKEHTCQHCCVRKLAIFWIQHTCLGLCEYDVGCKNPSNL